MPGSPLVKKSNQASLPPPPPGRASGPRRNAAELPTSASTSSSPFVRPPLIVRGWRVAPGSFDPAFRGLSFICPVCGRVTARLPHGATCAERKGQADQDPGLKELHNRPTRFQTSRRSGPGKHEHKLFTHLHASYGSCPSARCLYRCDIRGDSSSTRCAKAADGVLPSDNGQMTPGPRQPAGASIRPVAEAQATARALVLPSRTDETPDDVNDGPAVVSNVYNKPVIYQSFANWPLIPEGPARPDPIPSASGQRIAVTGS